ncbi:hypothetical protein M8C21_026979 [Ambrosia artemisiifolia]|uniref:Uncharacterized protein n=1 Tax=Ambrosia artemisiifolia TaxID=4212 RepID=A0AAD5CXS1_AMBAR|nr:hypothetical protein M8C21_026979 [Ambrosia artemisiifolia]
MDLDSRGIFPSAAFNGMPCRLPSGCRNAAFISARLLHLFSKEMKPMSALATIEGLQMPKPHQFGQKEIVTCAFGAPDSEISLNNT